MSVVRKTGKEYMEEQGEHPKCMGKWTEEETTLLLHVIEKRKDWAQGGD